MQLKFDARPRKIQSLGPRSSFWCTPVRILALLGVAAVGLLGYVSLSALAKLPLLSNAGFNNRALLRTTTLSAPPLAKEPLRQEAQVQVEIRPEFTIEPHLIVPRPVPPTTGISQPTGELKPHPAVARDPGCHPLGGRPHSSTGPYFFECFKVHPSDCTPKVHSPAAFESFDPRKFSVMNLKDGIKMMASSDPKEVIAFHMKSTQEVVCPAELIEELTIAKNEGRHEVFLDIGSNIGSCAVIALKLGHSVLAFEPGAENVHLWRENILLNRDLYPKHKAGEPRQFAILLPYAAAEKVSELALLLDPANAGNAMVLDLSRGKSVDDYFPGFVVDQANMIEKVCILSVDWLYTTLRRYDKAQGPQKARALSSTDADEQWAGAIDPGSGILPLAGISRYLDATSIIKIDIQGHEFKAFKGMAKFLKDQTKSYIRRKEAENGGKQYEMALRKVRSDESITAGLHKQPMLAPPPTPAEPRSPGLPPLPLAYGHLRSIFFELSMEIVFRKGDQPDQVYPWLLEKGYGITVEHDRLIPKGEFEAMVDLSPNGHDHNPSANLDLIAKRMDMLYASGV